MPEVYGAGGVGRHELQIDLLAGQERAPPVLLALVDHEPRERTGGRRVEADVEEARPGDLDGFDPIDLAQLLGQGVSKVTWCDTDLLGQLQRDRGGIVAVLRVTRTLHTCARRQQIHVEAAVVENGPSGG